MHAARIVGGRRQNVGLLLDTATRWGSLSRRLVAPLSHAAATRVGHGDDATDHRPTPISASPAAAVRATPSVTKTEQAATANVHSVTAKCPFSAAPLAAAVGASIDASPAVLTPSSAATDRPRTAALPASQVPGPRSLPLLGTSYKYLPWVGPYDLKNLEDYTMKMYRQYGKIVRDEPFPGKVIYRLFDPEDIGTVFHNEGFSPSRPDFDPWLEYRRDRKVVGGLSNVTGDEWLRMRRPVNKRTMDSEVVQSYIPAQLQVARDFVNLVRMRSDENHEVDDFISQLHKWAAESVGVVIFNARLGTLDPEAKTGSEVMGIVDAVSVLFDMLYTTQFLWPIHKSKKTRTWARFCQHMDYLYATSRTYVEECLQRMDQKDQQDHSLETNFLMSLLASKSELTLDDVVSIVAELFFAGTETTAYFLGFALYNLAKHPDKQQILREEIDRVVPPGTPVTPDTLENLPYLRGVMNETHRVTPVGSYFLRVLERDLVLSGYLIPKGSVVFPYISVCRRLPEYFPDPDEFRPERFANRDTRIEPFTHLPFGHGPRGCVGRRFAKQEVALTLISIMQNFYLEYPDEEVTILCRLTNHPDKPLRVRFVDRE